MIAGFEPECHYAFWLPASASTLDSRKLAACPKQLAFLRVAIPGTLCMARVTPAIAGSLIGKPQSRCGASDDA